jgi:hypothetical protein
MRSYCLLVAVNCPTITIILLRTSHEVVLSTGNICCPTITIILLRTSHEVVLSIGNICLPIYN